MQVSKNPTISQAPIKSKKPPAAPKESKNGSVLRDVLSIGGAAAAGTVGGVYGLAEGSIKGARANYGPHIKSGAGIGKAILTPVGGASGAIATGVTAAVAGVGSVVGAVLAPTLGFLGGTVASAVTQLPSSVSQTASAGARIGGNAGRALGSVGAVLGTMVGGTIGAVSGLLVAAGKGVPTGLKAGKAGAALGGNLVKGVPKFTKDTWNIAYHGGRATAGGLGAVVGGTGGVVSATGSTAIDGLAGGVRRGAQWGKSASDYIQGNNDSPPKDEPQT